MKERMESPIRSNFTKDVKNVKRSQKSLTLGENQTHSPHRLACEVKPDFWYGSFYQETTP